jgi:hypothetical protein
VRAVLGIGHGSPVTMSGRAAAEPTRALGQALRSPE